MYSNISELAPSFKENIIYSKVEETSKQPEGNQLENVM